MQAETGTLESDNAALLPSLDFENSPQKGRKIKRNVHRKVQRSRQSHLEEETPSRLSIGETAGRISFATFAEEPTVLSDGSEFGAGTGGSGAGRGGRESKVTWRSNPKLNASTESFFEKSNAQAAPPAGFLPRACTRGVWPSPFPGYKGLFTYQVEADKRETDRSLGNGVYLWMLEILAGTAHLGVSEDDTAATTAFCCQMKKTLVDLPSDACEEMKACRDKYVIEQWYGRAELESKVFVLSKIAEQPVNATINFDGLPLPREALAGEYEMELAKDDSVVKAIHVSWMNFANLPADEASGFMFRVNEGSSVCPVLRPASIHELEGKLLEAVELLKGSRVYQRGEAHRVRYWPTFFRVTEISTTSGTFQADLELAMDYLVPRDDVFEYIIRPDGWKPRWIPRPFEALNAKDMESVRTQIYPPTLKLLVKDEGRELRAELLMSYRGVFAEQFELQSFPFDVQPLHVKLTCEQDYGVEMERCQASEELMQSRLQKKWMNTEWKLLDFKVQEAHKSKGLSSAGGRAMAARLFVSCRVQRHAWSYLIRIVGVVLLICLLSVCIFVIDPADAIAEMVGHAFMMMLTLTTFSLVVGDILPNLGYLTVLDFIILFCFVVLAIIVLQVTYLGWVPTVDEEIDLIMSSRTFAIFDVIGIFCLCAGLVFYVNRVIIANELCKRPLDPEEDLNDGDAEGDEGTSPKASARTRHSNYVR